MYASPSGKLVQIEYALNAVAAGAPSVGIKGIWVLCLVIKNFLFTHWEILYSDLSLKQQMESYWQRKKNKRPRCTMIRVSIKSKCLQAMLVWCTVAWVLITAYW